MSQERSARRKTEGRPAPLPALPCACANLRRAARAVSQIYDAALRPAGLTTAQFTLLQTLSLAGRVTQRRLGGILVLDTTTLSRTLRPLQKRGWVRRRPGEDRRERLIELTRAGREVFEAALPHWNRAQTMVLARLGRRRWSVVLRELTLLADLPTRL
jgi:DNA-binding MarR family transcriptional regulator